ncbi:NADH dehydrogenase [ubiquinone] 1 alpha subcomplex subunit 5 [Hetaerina americana]|uniref:NADH dehydrogenase [ubiquinone] 1 alpha subcomplex subunit 5 n=1 Tax=Hetaerina americana TaxID=62018 RepID=UPI003A7F2F86
MASGAIKKTTKLTLLPVAKNPHYSLGALYNKTLRVLQKMPETAAYRKYTEQIVEERAQHVQSEPDVAKLEEKINCGQIEEVIIQAENELNLARRMLAWKPWEPLCQEPPANQWKWPIGKV